MITTIFWDNDGVLVDSEKWFFAASRDVLKEKGLELTEEQFIDISLKKGCGVLSLLKKLGYKEKEIISLREKRNAIYDRYLMSENIAVEDSGEVLEKLNDHYRMVIVTGSCREHFDTQHKKTGYTKYFEKIFAAGDYEKQKPHPDGYLQALKDLNISADEVIVVEDSPRGIKSAKAAGLKVIAVKSGFSKYFDHREADFVVDKLKELPSLIETI